jgi:hypothetical protein
MKKIKQSKKSEQNFPWSFVIVCFLLAGAVLLNMVSSRGREVVQKNNKIASDRQNIGEAFIVDNWMDYSVAYLNKSQVFVKSNKEGKKSIIKTPFDLNDYNYKLTSLGAIFWPKGELREANFGDTQDKFQYAYGADPGFKFYSYNSGQFIDLPKLTLSLGEQVFERIYSLHPSISENKILIEIGKYDTQSQEFEPGFAEEQPVSVRGVVFDLDTMSYTEDHSLEVYLKALKLTTSMWYGMYWDSAHKIAVAAPQGEGCGAAGEFTVVDLNNGKLTVIDGSNQKIATAVYNFLEQPCNPHNAVSPDGKWFVLYGESDKSNLVMHLYNISNFSNPVASKIISSPVSNNIFIKNWILDKPYPVLVFEENDFFAGVEPKVDFNDPNPEIISGWKTYTSAKHAFQFDYPASWSVVENHSEDIFGSTDIKGGVVTFVYEKEPSKDYGGVYVYPITKKGEEYFVNSWNEKAKSLPDQYSQPESGELAGETVLTRNFAMKNLPREIEFIFPNKGILLSIPGFHGDGKNSAEYTEKVRGLILNSFKFVE